MIRNFTIGVVILCDRGTRSGASRLSVSCFLAFIFFVVGRLSFLSVGHIFLLLLM